MNAYLLGLGVALLFSSVGFADGTTTAGTAERLVAESVRAEVSGNAALRASLLDQAVDSAPDYKLARWHRGEVEVDGQWQTVDAAQQAAAADPCRAEYLRLRASASNSLAGQLALARWCRKNNLTDEAWFHWANVVAREPGNEEALRALGMRWYENRLLTFAQIDAAKQRAREVRQAAKRWAPRVTKWQREIAGELPAREAALAEIRALADPDAIPALENVTLAADVSDDLQRVRCRQVSRALVDALREMPAQAAAESLVRHALFLPVTDVRDAAIAALRERPLHDYVPLLLNSLAMPIESSFRVATDSDGSVHYWHSLYREGPDGDWSLDLRRSAVQHDLGSLRYTYDLYTKALDVRSSPQAAVAAAAEKARVATRHEERFGSAATATESQLGQLNQAIAAWNPFVISLLRATTGQNLSEHPKAWWDWWHDQNEYYRSDDRPVERYYDTASVTYYHGGARFRYVDSSPPPEWLTKLSCFSEGTPVWTKTGQQAIETLQIGDLVLAQDVETGELAYKPVLGRTVRPPTEIVRLSLGGEELRTTLGHPLWVAGSGWRMAKELGDGAILHGVDGPVRVEAIEPAGEAEAYNLIVADFSTYFVGECGVLVHDNTPRQPTTAAVPGLGGK